MKTQTRVQLQTLVLVIFVVHPSLPVCVDVLSETEAVLGKNAKLTCISCMKREEVKSVTYVDWFYLPKEGSLKYHIYKYDGKKPVPSNGWNSRLHWNGSQDLQDVSINIINATYNDSGIYECHVFRKFEYDSFTPSATLIKNITLTVKEKASDDATAIYSEIMMYVLLVFLTFWLLVEMVYCYRKISKSDEEAQDTATNYLAIPSEQKDNPAAPVTE